MRYFRGIVGRFSSFFRRKQFECDLAEEMQFHLEEQARDNEENGMDADDARHAARRQFGNPSLLAEAGREAWGWGPLERVEQDFRYALRMVARTPGFSATVVLVLALGIGGGTAVFSLINALLLNPFPYPQRERLVAIRVHRKGGGLSTSLPIRDFFNWQGHSTMLDGIAAYGWNRANVTGLGEPERMIGGLATSGFLRVLGVQPALGRYFTQEEDLPGGPPVVVLSHATWLRRFSGRPDILGRSLALGGVPHTIVGVMPARFALPGMFTCEFWRPARHKPTIARGTWNTGDHLIARLKPGASLAASQAELAVIAGRLDAAYPEVRRDWEPAVVPIGQELAEDTSSFLKAPTVAVGLVLLLACANLAGLMLARSSSRLKEMAVRASLGASRGRLVRQTLTEAVLLSLAGGGLGLLVAHWGIQALIAAAPPNAGLGSSLRIDGPVLLFALAVSILTGVIFGLAPAIFGSRPGLEPLLRGGTSLSGVPARGHFLSGLVITEVALALVLLIGGGLLLKSFSRLLQVELGVVTEHILTFRFALSGSKYASGQRRGEFYRTLLARLRSIPAVRDAGAVDPLPMSGEYAGGGFQIEGRPVPANWRDMAAQYCSAAPGYFRTMGIPVLRGREFTEADGAGAPAVVINRELARRFFPGEDPLGRRISGQPVIGVVGDVRHNGPGKVMEPQIYIPLTQAWSASVAVRTTGDPKALVRLVRDEVRALDPDLPLERIKSMQEVVSDSVATARLIGSILGGFSIFGLALAALGIYGVIAYSVNQRTHEIGIRVALGASRKDVLAMVVRRGALLGAGGVAAGIPPALLASHAIQSLLFGVKPRDVAVFAGVCAVLLAAVLAASYIPARRAAKVDPMVALRCE